MFGNINIDMFVFLILMLPHDLDRANQNPVNRIRRLRGCMMDGWYKLGRHLILVHFALFIKAVYTIDVIMKLSTFNISYGPGLHSVRPVVLQSVQIVGLMK